MYGFNQIYSCTCRWLIWLPVLIYMYLDPSHSIVAFIPLYLSVAWFVIYIYIYVCICHIYAQSHMQVYTCTYMNGYIATHIQLYAIIYNCMHTWIRNYMHAYILCKHTINCNYMYTCIHTYMYNSQPTYSCTCVYARTHMEVYAYAHVGRSLIDAQIRNLAPRCAYIYTNMYTHIQSTYTDTCVPVYKHVHMYIHMHTYTYTYI